MRETDENESLQKVDSEFSRADFVSPRARQKRGFTGSLRL